MFNKTKLLIRIKNIEDDIPKYKTKKRVWYMIGYLESIQNKLFKERNHNNTYLIGVIYDVLNKLYSKYHSFPRRAKRKKFSLRDRNLRKMLDNFNLIQK